MALVVAALTLALVLVGTAAALPGLIPQACGCAATPTRPPGWTPWPASLDTAIKTYSERTHESVERAWSSEYEVAGEPYYRLAGPNTIGYAEGNSGSVDEMVRIDRLPQSDRVSISRDQASGTAQRYFGAAPAALNMSQSTELVQTANVAYYVFTYRYGPDPATRVYVNADTGEIFAEVENFSVNVTFQVPVIGFAAAQKLAAASQWMNGHTPDALASPLSSDLDGSPPGFNGQTWSWDFIDNGRDPAVPVTVNAITGEVVPGMPKP